MTSRQAGRRISTIASEHRRTGRRRSAVPRRSVGGKKESLGVRERRYLIQLVACGSIFILLVAAKLLLPEKMAQLDQRLAASLEKNMDVQAVFSAVGRAFSGEADLAGAAKDVYQAVFHPQEPGEPMETAAALPLPETHPALDALQVYREREPEREQPEASSLAYVLYSEQNLPDSVSLEQAILGFDYCVPVSGPLTSGFGYREHPIEGEERFHYGVDLAADTGTDILCFADGKVTAVGESSSYGKYCTVAHEGGYSTLYAHCSRVTVSSGAAVARGEKVAEVGQTGVATGPHLHFELHREGIYLNPIYYVAAS